MGECAWVIGKQYTILHKGLEHPGILVFEVGTNHPQLLKENCILLLHKNKQKKTVR